MLSSKEGIVYLISDLGKGLISGWIVYLISDLGKALISG